MGWRAAAVGTALSTVLLIAGGEPALAQTSPAKPPVEAFAALPSISELKLAPDGKHMAALQTYQGRIVVVIYEVGAPPGTMPAILADDQHFIKGIRWANNERLLVAIYDIIRDPYLQMRRFPAYRLISVDTKAQNGVVLFNNSKQDDLNHNMATVADIDLDDENHIIMPIYARHYDDIGYDLYKVDVVTGHVEVLQHGTNYIIGGTNTQGYLFDGHGNLVARLDHSEEPLVDTILIYKNGSWQKLASYSAEADSGAGAPALSSDGTKLVQIAMLDTTGTNGVVARDLATGTESVLFSDPKYDVAGYAMDEWTGRVIGAIYQTDITKTVYFDPAMQALQKGLEATFPDCNVVLTSMTLARDKVTVMVSSAIQPPTYYLLDRNTHFAGRVGQAYPKIKYGDIGTVKPYPYKARDGLDIPAYVTLPPGKDAKNLPAVVMPHGGPDYRDSMDFDYWAQFLANRGYVVLQPNFRGSAGYGRKFTDAGLNQWGLKLQDDISDGVKTLIADGIADPKRICIVGASFGGYAALAGATLTPDLYACAVSYAGISDLPQLITTTRDEDGPASQELSFWVSRIGDTDKDRARLEQTSPALHADKVKIPILLLHGESDYTVRIDQSEEMANRLKAAGKPVEFIRFKHDDHNLSRSESRIQLLTEIEKFLAKYIGN